MILINMTNPLTLILMLIITVLLIFLAQEVKKSYIGAIALFGFLALLIVHVFQILTLSEEFRTLLPVLSRCIAIDFVFVFITFFSYLWVDDLEAKKNNIKSIDNSLDWFWKEI